MAGPLADPRFQVRSQSAPGVNEQMIEPASSPQRSTCQEATPVCWRFQAPARRPSGRGAAGTRARPGLQGGSARGAGGGGGARVSRLLRGPQPGPGVLCCQELRGPKCGGCHAGITAARRPRPSFRARLGNGGRGGPQTGPEPSAPATGVSHHVEHSLMEMRVQGQTPTFSIDLSWDLPWLLFI
nr:uncharacterized protein LOC105092192 [Camelus dromedarius]